MMTFEEKWSDAQATITKQQATIDALVEALEDVMTHGKAIIEGSGFMGTEAREIVGYRMDVDAMVKIREALKLAKEQK